MRSQLAHRLERRDLGTLRAQLLSLNGSETRLDSFVIQLCQKRLSERMADGEYRTEVAQPKGTLVTLFDMRNFISCVHLA